MKSTLKHKEKERCDTCLMVNSKGNVYLVLHTPANSQATLIFSGTGGSKLGINFEMTEIPTDWRLFDGSITLEND